MQAHIDRLTRSVTWILLASRSPAWTRALGFNIALATSAVCGFYAVTRFFPAFVIVYGAVQIGMLALLVASLASAETGETEQRRCLRQTGARLAKSGMIVGALSIIPWALDSAFCDTLIAARRALGSPLSIVTQWHALWHLGTGF